MHPQRIFRPFGTRMRPQPALLVLASVLLAVGSAVAAPPVDTAPPPHASTAASAALARERETLDGVVAASLVAALSEELGGRPVKIRLDRVDVAVSGMRDRTVRGQGQLQIEGTDDWLGFRFNTLYDAFLESAGYPELSIGSAGPDGRAVPNDARLVRDVEDRVVARLAEEFDNQKVRLQLDRIDTLETGDRYLRIDAAGIADFGLDGTAPVKVEGLYDRIRSEWLRVSYSLDGAADASSSAPSSPGAAPSGARPR